MPLPLSFSIGHIGMIALLVFGFGFVIFWHELGHFLAAKWVGIKVEQFAVGFGPAIISWRRGIGVRLGNSQQEYHDRAEKLLLSRQRPAAGSLEKPEFTDMELSKAADELQLGDTEYRLNWIPLGGYVKMLGQDDLKPDALAEDPRAYNKKSIGARMLVISAGVIMNVILAGIGFMILFLIGFHVPPAWVGNVIPNSPAQRAGLRPGDHLVQFNGHSEADFTKITLDTALVAETEPITMMVMRPKNLAAASQYPENPADFDLVTLTVTPSRRAFEKQFLAIGFEPPRQLESQKLEKGEQFDPKKYEGLLPPEAMALLPGDTITAINGQRVGPKDFMMLDKIVQESFGKPLTLTIKSSTGAEREVASNLHFQELFNPPFNIAGMQPRVQIYSFDEKSHARGEDKLHLGDVILSIKLNDNNFPHPTREQLIAKLDAAGHQKKPIDVLVLRDGKAVTVTGLKTMKVDRDRFGLGIAPFFDERSTVVADVTENSPAKVAGLSPGDTVLSVNRQPVKTWADVHRVIAQMKPDEAAKGIAIEYQRDNVTDARVATLTLTAEQLAAIRDLRYQADIQLSGMLAEFTIERKTSNPLTASAWGVVETRDFILQFYLTLRRMVSGSVSPSNMMGPVGIFTAGAHFAYKGIDWLLWFLCMISANLAVVNFLPIPIVDGGHFMFLTLEKIKGKPLSPRAMTIAQYVGLAFLAAVVLFVTFNDISREFLNAW